MTVEKTSPRVLRRVLLALVVIAAGALAVAPWAVEALVTPDTSTALTATPASDPNHLVFDVLPILLVLAAVVVALAAVREVARGVRADRDRERSRS